MKKLNSFWMLVCGAALGVGLTLCVGADGVSALPKATPPAVQMVTYPNGMTGFFDPGTGKIYLYDLDSRNCIMVRQVTTLGQPLGRP